MNALIKSGLLVSTEDGRVKCGCGSVLQPSSVNKHLTTIKHTDYIKSKPQIQEPYVFQQAPELVVAEPEVKEPVVPGPVVPEPVVQQAPVVMRKVRNRSMKSLYAEAISSEDGHQVRELLCAGYVPPSLDEDMVSWISRKGDVRTISTFIDAGADVDFLLGLPLKTACFKRNTRIVKLLLFHSASLDLFLKNYDLPGTLAQYLLDIGVNHTGLMYIRAVKASDKTTICQLLDSGYRPESLEQDMIEWIKNGNMVAAVYTAIGAGVDIHYDNELPLRWAIYHCYARTTSYLMNAGANLRAALSAETFKTKHLVFLHNNGYTIPSEFKTREFKIAIGEDDDNSMNAQVRKATELLQQGKIADAHAILDTIMKTKIDCSICMEDSKHGQYTCDQCNNSICMECRQRLIMPTCPFCRCSWS